MYLYDRVVKLSLKTALPFTVDESTWYSLGKWMARAVNYEK